MEPKDFECLRCGTCCQTILQSADGVTRGLPLTEKETSLFPPEAISPRLAVGVKEPETVVLWQLNTNVCPHLGNANDCQKYASRPLICRSFPIVAGAISNRCKVFSYRKPGVSYKEPYTMASQVGASDKLTAYIHMCLKKHAKKGLQMWEYNLATGKWVNGQKI